MAAENNDQPQSISLQVVTPGGMVEDAKVNLVTIPGVEGVFGVMPGHSPFFTLIAPGVISYDEGGMPRELAVSGGFVEVTQGKTLVLARTAEKKDDIDLDRAHRAKRESEERLVTMSFEDEGRKAVEEELGRAVARIAVASGESIQGH
ncbi:MAG: ATP synthase F1 subunit epsilon [Nitrospinae bacterium]|nr:ATP synthase F1 subunit epsilon [Nitrospinota bacterium]